MRTTLNIDEELLSAAMRSADVKTKTEAVELGLRALIQLHAALDLADMAGAQPDLDPPPRRRPRPA